MVIRTRSGSQRKIEIIHCVSYHLHHHHLSCSKYRFHRIHAYYSQSFQSYFSISTVSPEEENEADDEVGRQTTIFASGGVSQYTGLRAQVQQESNEDIEEARI